MIEQLIEFILPKKWWEAVDTAIPKSKRRRILLWLCAVSFIYASFSAYDNVNMRLQSVYERNRDLPIDFQTFKSSEKRLRPDQSKIISNLIYENKNIIGKLHFARYLSGNTVMYSGDILDALKRSGVEVVQDIVAPDTPDQTGVMVACDDPNNVPESIKIIIGIFHKADINVNITNMLTQAKKRYVGNGCILFVGPDPL